jgi:Rrf2 family protein
MQLPQTVEWALHCCWLLAQSNGDATIRRREFAEFFDLPEPYLAKVLKRLTAARILTSVPGVNGGYRLARPASAINALEVVNAVGGQSTFHCTEIRQNGPVGLDPAQCTQPCGIAKLMHTAEVAWRNELAKMSLADLIESALPASEGRAAKWLGDRARPELRERVGARTPGAT